MWFLKEILKEMKPQSALDLIRQSTTAMLDSEVAEKLTTGSTGLLARAPHYITQELIDTLDMFQVAI